MNKFLLAGMAALSFVGAAHSATVVDGNFESLTLAPPIAAGTSGYQSNNLFGSSNALGYANTTDGSNSAYINSGWNFLTGSTTGTLTFLLADMAVNQTYSVSFLSALNPYYAGNSFTLSYNGAQIGSYSAASTSWTTGSAGVFTATNTTGSLTFTGSTVASGGAARSVGIDAVSINAVSAPVPEPATWAMMVGGFGLLGAMLRRRRPVRALI